MTDWLRTNLDKAIAVIAGIALLASCALIVNRAMAFPSISSSETVRNPRTIPSNHCPQEPSVPPSKRSSRRRTGSDTTVHS